MINISQTIINKLSIKAKLLSIIGIVSTLTMFLLFSTLIYTQRTFLRKSLLKQVTIIANDISGNLAAALIFDDRQAISEALDNFSKKEQILLIQIKAKTGETFTHYGKADTPHMYPVTPIRTLLRQGHVFGETLEIGIPLQHKNQALGTLYIQADLSDISQTLIRYATFGLLGLMGSSMLGFLLAIKLQKIISKPVEQLATAMNSVSQDKDYSRRIANNRIDEMGVLIENFNNMLTQIQHRDHELSDQRKHLDHLAHHDCLTGLPNRLLFRDRLSHALSRGQRSGNKVGLLFLDLDRFKNINDTLGHDIGDIVLQLVTRRLKDQIRNEDTLARLGGDEFVLVAEEIRDARSLSLLADKILHAMTEPFTINDQDLFITTSIGISVYPEDGDTVENLMKCADVAMYRSKEIGRNTYRFFTNGMNEQVEETLFLENSMRKALQNGEFILYYQPQIDLFSNTVHGMEALLRWQHPTLGLIPPGKFISVAEESGLILPIGRWVLSTACRQAKEWQESGLPPCKVAVNISPKQFCQADLCEMVSQALTEAELAPECLEIEITETAIMLDMAKAIQTMKNLVALGISLSIDDFGTGYSSLSCLENFPINNLKIDRSFISKVNRSEENGALAEGIIALANTLKLGVIAEGVETEYQKIFLKKRGCQIGQGYYLSYPIPAEDCQEYLKDRNLPAPIIKLKDRSEPIA
jgi:diguanylate cyclase (GGDEF)-like protein